MPSTRLAEPPPSNWRIEESNERSPSVAYIDSSALIVTVIVIDSPTFGVLLLTPSTVLPAAEPTKAGADTSAEQNSMPAKRTDNNFFIAFLLNPTILFLINAFEYLRGQ